MVKTILRKRSRGAEKLEKLRAVKKKVKVVRCGITDPKEKKLTAQGFLELNGLSN